MSRHVLRRTLLASGSLLAFAVLAGWLFVVLTPVPPVAVAVVGLGIVTAQFLVAPAAIEWLVPAAVIPQTDGGYDSDEPLAVMVERQCRLAGVPLVRLGVVDDGEPNAFTFGRTRRDARVWISRGLLERLDDREVEAVVAHEIGHVAHRDVAVVTVASVVPMFLYWATAGVRDSGDGGATSNDSDPQRVAILIAYLLSQLAFLGLVRARELAADHASCAATGDGDALCSALVKISYGMGKVRHERAVMLKDLRGEDEHKKARRIARREHRMRSVGALGIASTGGTPGFAAMADDLSPERVLGAMRWEATNPWGRYTELLSTHPLTVNRIAALERSGLPGAPRQWPAVREAAVVTPGERARSRRRFLAELPVYLGGWLLLAAALVLLRTASVDAEAVISPRTVSLLLVGAGFLLLVRAVTRSPLRPFSPPEPVDEIASLHARREASPVNGIAVSLRGRISGRGGLVVSPDLMLADDSGFVPLAYLQPLPGMRTLFGLLSADDYLDENVLVTGWYLRGPVPYVELRSVMSESGLRARCWMFTARYAWALAILLSGALLLTLTS